MTHRTRENSLLIRLPIYYKGCTSGTARWKRCIGQGIKEGALSRLTEPLTTMCVQPRSFPNTSFWLFSKASLGMHDWLNHWSLVITSNFSPSPLFRGWMVRLKILSLLITCWFLWQPALNLWLSWSFPKISFNISSSVIEKSLLGVTNTSFSLFSLGPFQGFGTLFQE